MLVAHAEQNEGRETVRVDPDTARIDSLSHELLTHKAPHRLVSHAADQGRPEPETCCSNGDIGGAPADSFGERRDLLQRTANLLPIQIYADATDRDEVQLSTHAESAQPAFDGAALGVALALRHKQCSGKTCGEKRSDKCNAAFFILHGNSSHDTRLRSLTRRPAQPGQERSLRYARQRGEAV